MEKKRILIFSEAFGAGHTKVATAIREEIQLLFPNWDVFVYEIGKELHPLRHHWFVNSYLKLLELSPHVWGRLYHWRQYRPLRPEVETLLHQVFYSKILSFLQKHQPDIVVCTHPFPSAAISYIKRQGIRVPLYTVITDYGVHGSWISSGVDRYYVPTWESFQKLLHLGVPSENILVSGLPVHPKFYIKQHKEEARCRLGLAQLPTLLMMGGGNGFGLSTKLLNTLLPFRHQLQVLIVTGKNRSLYKELAKHPLMQSPNCYLYGYVEQIETLMDASDFILTKPGGVTCTEAIIKGIPLLFYQPLPGQEEENMDYFVSKGYGIHVESPKHMAMIMRYVLENALFDQNQEDGIRFLTPLRLAATLA
ncbi:MGDG synthase family glycosyltransferase [Rubeoparvulum massiliense]|uniref:MGDG synthase family glycosyltransferase n=1 Tax=Rubeoparvulum massiliense TaxID=1631346 RepID=UPI00065DDE47|nr:glycosyltransferase [Rubeoparvulum massiliense]